MTQNDPPSPSSRPHSLAEILAKLPQRPPMPPVPEEPAVVHCVIHGDFPGKWVAGPVRNGVQNWEPDGSCPGCEADAKVARLMGKAGIAKRFQNCSLENFVADTDLQREVLEVCKLYVKQFPEVLATGRCLGLIGRPGTGKNHLSAGICRAVAAQGFTSLHSTAHELVKRIRATWTRQDDETEEDVLRAISAVDLLVIDEVGRSFGTDGERVHLFEIIDRRYRDMRPTVIISNRTLKEVEEYLGEAAYDRLRENGGMVLEFDWPSHRPS